MTNKGYYVIDTDAEIWCHNKRCANETADMAGLSRDGHIWTAADWEHAKLVGQDVDSEGWR